jgi:hypothetical protein
VLQEAGAVEPVDSRILKLEPKRAYNEENETYFDEPVVRAGVGARGEGLPLLYGEFNDWVPSPMIPLHELCVALDKAQAPNFFRKMKETNKCRDSVFHEHELRKEERKHYLTLRELHRTRYLSLKPKEWSKLIQKFLKYEEPQITNLAQLENA